MGNNKNALPEKIKGKVRIAGQSFDVGSVKSKPGGSIAEVKNAVKYLSKKKIFSLPNYILNE